MFKVLAIIVILHYRGLPIPNPTNEATVHTSMHTIDALWSPVLGRRADDADGVRFPSQ